MNRVLIFLEHYFPGYKSGGPAQTIKNITDILGKDVEFSIITLDRDIGEKTPYSNIQAEVWHKVGNANVLYLPPSKMTFSNIVRVYKENTFDFLYLNSFFSFRFSILPMLVYNFVKPRAKLIVAPRGEFSLGALGLKKIKKKSYIKVASFLGFYKSAIFHASTSIEKEDVLAAIGKKVRIVIAKDLPNITVPKISKKPDCSLKGESKVLKICFISRIVPMKNLDYAIRLLGACEKPIEFSIFGHKEDLSYWEKCKNLLEKLPPNVRWSYAGTLHPDSVKSTFSTFDIFLFPTRGENYGHVIAEALLSGAYPLISDQTPWLTLEGEGIGRIIPLSKMEGFIEEINTWSDMSLHDRHNKKIKIQEKAMGLVIDKNDIEENKALFRNLS